METIKADTTIMIEKPSKDLTKSSILEPNKPLAGFASGSTMADHTTIGLTTTTTHTVHTTIVTITTIDHTTTGDNVHEAAIF